ncbi:MAG: DUF4212 domain-containing protein [Candidatus Hydrogenedens sp.]|nr:DUF4212 domain-containing protein [Candidatus Hydrogenedens sp.]
MNEELAKAYWRANLKVIGALLSVWALAGLIFGVLLVEPLNRIAFGGVPFGFWMAQQGAIFIFVVLIFVYAFVMERVDHRFRVDKDEE